MKYNPKINEEVCNSFADLTPLAGRILPGALRMMADLSRSCARSRRRDAVTLQPAAGAHGS